MIITTAATIAGRRIVNTIGLVRGNTVRARHAGRDIMAGLKTLVGGEIVSYTEMMEEARREAVQRLIADAEGQGANAVTDVRFLIGYLPKQFVAAKGTADAPAYPGVAEICNVSECFAKSPPDWIDYWRHNTDTWLFDSAEAAWSVVLR